MPAEDTSLKADARYHDLLMRMTPSARLDASMRLSQAVRELAIAGIRARHPQASDDEVRVRLAARLYGRANAHKLFGRLPDDV
jgi:hypothetical protein